MPLAVMKGDSDPIRRSKVDRIKRERTDDYNAMNSAARKTYEQREEIHMELLATLLDSARKTKIPKTLFEQAVDNEGDVQANAVSAIAEILRTTPMRVGILIDALVKLDGLGRASEFLSDEEDCK